MKMQLMNETFRYDVLNNQTIYKKEKNLLKQNYLFHGNLQFQKFIMTSPSVLPGCGTRTKLICTPANLFPQPCTSQLLGKHDTLCTLLTLANFKLHPPLISFIFMIPSCKEY